MTNQKLSPSWEALGKIRYYVSLYRTNDASSSEVLRMIGEVLESPGLDESTAAEPRAERPRGFCSLQNAPSCDDYPDCLCGRALNRSSE